MAHTDDPTLEATDFRPGTFAPDPRRAPVAAMVRSQAFIEAKLFLRHGEQLLVNFIMPIAGLVVFALVPHAHDALQRAFPLMLAMAAISAGFTGQAISLAFDRRYGALKRTGASGVPSWTIVAGKLMGVVCVSLLQIVLLGLVAFALGWRASVGSAVVGVVVFFLGVAAFSAFGLLVGGSLPSEVVLGLANLIWVALVGVASYALFELSTDAGAGLVLIPSIALAQGIHIAFQGGIPWVELIILLGYGALAALGASRWFKFSN